MVECLIEIAARIRSEIEKKHLHKVMKFCPTCQTRFDEEIIRFCTKDGTPLIEEETPNFTELPSESATDDFSEETVIRRNDVNVSPAPDIAEDTFVEPKEETSSRLVIPTVPEKHEPQIRTKQIAYQSPAKPNTAKIVALTILTTLITLAGVGILFVFLNKSNNETENITYNTNLSSQDLNLNTNLPINNSLFNANANINSNLDTNVNMDFNTNLNANLKTPTPKPSPSPSVSPTPEEEGNANSNANTNTNSSNSATPSPTVNGNSKTTLPPPPPLPTASPRPSPSATPRGRSLSNTLANDNF